MGKFKKGIVVGGVLGAAMMWLNTTAKGKSYRTKIVDHAGDVYEKVREELSGSEALKNMNKNKYVAHVRKVVDKYAIENGMADNVKNMVVKLVSAQWSRLQKEGKTKKK